MQYIVNIDIENLDKVDISSPELANLKNDSVLIWLSTESNARLYEYYLSVKGLLVNGNRVLLLMDGEKSMIRKQICMLLATYQNYDMYIIKDKDLVNFDYVMSLLDREPTVEEVETFIGSDMAMYDKVNDLLTAITDLVRKEKYEELTELFISNINLMDTTINVVEYLKNLAINTPEGFQKTIDSLKKELKSKENELKDQDVMLKSKNYALNQQQLELEDCKKDLNKYKQELEKASSNSKDPVILNYSTLNMNVTKAKTGAVIYFKEIGKLRYINTFVVSLLTLLEKRYKLSCKLLIYDSNINFNIYKPLSYVDSRTYNEKKDVFLDPSKNTKMVIIEPASNILTDIVKYGYDVVIIYDRLRGNDDLITGAQVYKYYVVSSQHEYKMLKNTHPNVPDDEIIGHPRISPNILAIGELPPEDVAAAESKRVQSYFQLKNTGTNKVPLIQSIIAKSNADKIK